MARSSRFHRQLEPARGLSYLQTWRGLKPRAHSSYHAADATPLGAEHFATLDADAVGDIASICTPRPRSIRSAYPILTIWAMNSGEQELAPIEIGAARTRLSLAPISK